MDRRGTRGRACGQAHQGPADCCESVQNVPQNEDVWLESVRLNTPSNAKVIIAEAVRHIPRSVNLWMQAAELERDVQRRKRVFRRALEIIPNSAKLWKAAVELEDPEDAIVILSRAVECVPTDEEIWLALARLETYEAAQAILNRARAALPGSAKIWIAACQLEEANGKEKDVVVKILRNGLVALEGANAVIKRAAWLKEAERAEAAGSPLTCAAIVQLTIGLDVDDTDRKRTFLADAEHAEEKGNMVLARAVYNHALAVFPKKKGVWLRAIAFERRSGANSNAIEAMLSRAVIECPHCEILFLMLAREMDERGCQWSSRSAKARVCSWA